MNSGLSLHVHSRHAHVSLWTVLRRHGRIFSLFRIFFDWAQFGRTNVMFPSDEVFQEWVLTRKEADIVSFDRDENVFLLHQVRAFQPFNEVFFKASYALHEFIAAAVCLLAELLLVPLWDLCLSKWPWKTIISALFEFSTGTHVHWESDAVSVVCLDYLLCHQLISWYVAMLIK